MAGHVAVVEPGIIDTQMAKILQIAESDTDQLRHPVGPDAAPLLNWRRAMSDQAWVALGEFDDEAWFSRIQRTSGWLSALTPAERPARAASPVRVGNAGPVSRYDQALSR